MSPYTLAQKAKAIAALVGSAVTLLLSALAGAGVVSLEIGGVNVLYVLSAISAGCTYVVTFKIPNAPAEDATPPPGLEIEGTH